MRRKGGAPQKLREAESYKSSMRLIDNSWDGRRGNKVTRSEVLSGRYKLTGTYIVNNTNIRITIQGGF